MTFIGIDNGVSGSIGVISPDEINYFKTPIKKELNYTKTKQWLNRIDINELISLLKNYGQNTLVLIERPMVNPGRFKATVSALRALEATLIAIETLQYPYRYIDSKEWQKEMLPKGLKGEQLKEASLQVGKRLFPNIDFSRYKDADGILISEYGRRRHNV